MDTDAITTDQLESELARLEVLRTRAAARQVALIAEADRRQLATWDGCRTLTDWVAWRLDISHDTAHAYVDLARRLDDLPQLAKRLDEGEIGFDRAALLAPLATADTETDLIGRLTGWDLQTVRRYAARHRRLTRRSEQRSHHESYVVVQPSLDESWWSLHGGLTATAGAAVQQALQQRADQLPPDDTPATHRQALALESLCLDGLDSSLPSGMTPRTPTVTAFYDWDLAAATNGQAGAEIAAGPRLGPGELDELICTGTIRHIGIHQNRPVVTTKNARTIPPAIRDYVLWRDGTCRAPGCTSRHRLQPHHIIPHSHGGRPDPTNLTTLCWYHHHVVIHRRQYQLEPTSDGKIRLVPPQDTRAPP